MKNEYALDQNGTKEKSWSNNGDVWTVPTAEEPRLDKHVPPRTSGFRKYYQSLQSLKPIRFSSPESTPQDNAGFLSFTTFAWMTPILWSVFRKKLDVSSLLLSPYDTSDVSTERSDLRDAEWLIGWVVGWLVGWLGGWLVEWLVGWLWLIGWVVGWLVGWLAGCVVGWLSGWLVGWLVDLLVGWVVGWVVVVGWLVGWLICWLVGWLVDWLGGWVVGWLSGWLVDLLVGWVVGWLVDLLVGWVVG
uniref:Uncharacterized protein n=1 Tax=Knipowitschia caucasica TaxID=637954 RepID=A0AAV2LRK4_KNICA